MFEWLKRIFCVCVFEPEPEPEIAAGELWRFVSDNSPWGPKNYLPVCILDVRDGWVRYDMGGVFRDERQQIKTFAAMYRRVDA